MNFSEIGKGQQAYRNWHLLPAAEKFFDYYFICLFSACTDSSCIPPMFPLAYPLFSYSFISCFYSYLRLKSFVFISHNSGHSQVCSEFSC